LSKAQGKHQQQTHTLPAAPCTGVGWSRNSSGRPFKSQPFPERNLFYLFYFSPMKSGVAQHGFQEKAEAIGGKKKMTNTVTKAIRLR
jgi:hypothetical protein